MALRGMVAAVRRSRAVLVRAERRRKSTVQSRGVGIFGALGLGGLDDSLEFSCIPSSAFERKDVSERGGRSGRGEEHKAGNTCYPVAAETGFGHSVVLTNDGKLFLFGRAFDINSVVRMYSIYKFSSYFARLSTNLTISADRDHKIEVIMSPFYMPGMHRYSFVKVACSGGLTAALTSTGQVFCFGVNKFGQCGTGDSIERYWFPSVNVGVPKALDVDVGFQHAICLCDGGDVYTWGKGKNGQMGNGEESEVNAHSIKVPLPVQATAVGAGLNHCAAVGKDGQVYIWGRRMADQLSEGSSATYEDQTFPRSVSLPHSLKATEVYCSSFTTVVKATDDTLWIIGIDEISQDVALEFKPVYDAAIYDEEKSYTQDELDQLPKIKYSSKGCTIKKGYHAVSVISECKKKVFDITLQRGTARLYEVLLEPRKDGLISDYSAGFRHCLLLTEDAPRISS